MSKETCRVAFQPFHGQVGWIPRLVSGGESRPCNHIYITRKPRPCGQEASLQNVPGRLVPRKPRPLETVSQWGG